MWSIFSPSPSVCHPIPCPWWLVCEVYCVGYIFGYLDVHTHTQAFAHQGECPPPPYRLTLRICVIVLCSKENWVLWLDEKETLTLILDKSSALFKAHHPEPRLLKGKCFKKKTQTYFEFCSFSTNVLNQVFFPLSVCTALCWISCCQIVAYILIPEPFLLLT